MHYFWDASPPEICDSSSSLSFGWKLEALQLLIWLGGDMLLYFMALGKILDFQREISNCFPGIESLTTYRVSQGTFVGPGHFGLCGPLPP